MRVALVYDRVNKWGGAERVLLTLHEMFPDAPLYTSVYSAKDASWAKVFPKIVTSPLQRIKFARNNHNLFPFLMPLLFESFDFSDFDLVISVTSEAAKGVLTQPHTRHICYCLTPTRYLWSGFDQYLSKFKQFVFYPLIQYLRIWDIQAASRPDQFICISNEVKNRVEKYYGRDSTVVYPPVSIRCGKKSIHKDKFFLVVSRLVPYKKVDLVIKAFNDIGEKLVIVGVGSEENRLRKMAKSNIEFLGQLTDKELVDYYSNTKALIMPQYEDFGLVSVEAQLNGIPVITYAQGGATESVIEGKTGVFFKEQTKEFLIEAISKFKKMKFKKADIVKNAQRFSKQNFKKNFLKEINI